MPVYDEVSLSRRERKKRNRRYAIIRAALDIFRDKGIDASINEITEAADISYATFYNYFSSKSDLLLAIYMDEMEDLAEFIDQHLASQTSMRKCIEDLFDIWMYDGFRYRYLGLSASEAFALYGTEEHAQQDVCQILGRFIRQGQQTGEFSAHLDAEQMALTIIGIRYAAIVYNTSKECYESMLNVCLDNLA